MKTIDIKGKPYVEVSERILFFRENYKNFALVSEIVSIEDGVIIMKATVYDPEGNQKATGFAYEKEDSTFINKTSYVENCETSAWGRALANFGIGITSVASADEVINAIENQKEKRPDSRSSGETVPIGKHKDKLWCDVPIGYLEWALGTDQGKPLYEGAKKEYDRRAVAPMEDDMRDDGGEFPF